MYMARVNGEVVWNVHHWELCLKMCTYYNWDLLTHYNRIYSLMKSSSLEPEVWKDDSLLDLTVMFLPELKDSLKTRYKDPGKPKKEELNYHAYQNVGVSYVKKNYGILQYPPFVKGKTQFQYAGEYQFVTTPADRVGYHVPKDKAAIQEWVNYINCMMKMDNSNRVRFLSHIDISFFRNNNPDDEG